MRLQFVSIKHGPKIDTKAWREGNAWIIKHESAYYKVDK